MQRIFFILVFCAASLTMSAQTSVKIGHLKGHVGDSVITCGKVEGGKYLSTASNSPTLINLGYDYPNQLLTIVIFGEFRSLFEGNPETDWKGRTLCVRGKVELYRDKPQIVVRNPNQISFEN